MIKPQPNYIEIVFQYFFLIVINLILMSVIGWMTLDSEANLNSLFEGFLLSFFIPSFIVAITSKMTQTERLLKFGTGFLVYIILSIITVGFPTAFVTGLLPCLAISLITLFYGEILFSKRNSS